MTQSKAVRLKDYEMLEIILGCFHAFRPDRALVLVFHLDCTMLRGTERHRHTEEEAMRGIYDFDKGRWERGRAGVSLSVWRQVNRELEDEGLLLVAKMSGQPAEYTPQLAAIRAAIRQWRERPAPHKAEP